MTEDTSKQKAAGELPIRVGISTCLLGQEVRWDGGHKRSRYITDILGVYFEFVPVCPELEVGMGVPREPVHLEGEVETPRLIGSRSGEDWTDRMNRYSIQRVKQLAKMRLSGYILKKDSPSCGMERVKITNNTGMPMKQGRGLFALELLRAFPMLPVEEEGRLNDARLRENFIVRVFAYHRLQSLFRGRWSRGQVVAFHAAHKLLLMAHSPRHYRELGQLVAAVKDRQPDAFREEYMRLFMEALAVKATTRKNVNVLQHLLGYLKRDLDAQQKQSILQVIEDYHGELVPLIVPVTLVRHYLELHGVEYANNQVYLNPHPKELMLRNHV
jgi:uncharacterized protein YbgA (DUF1722 family)/uncharacterized protein YbbK (DUF523 family)